MPAGSYNHLTMVLGERLRCNAVSTMGLSIIRMDYPYCSGSNRGCLPTQRSLSLEGDPLLRPWTIDSRYHAARHAANLDIVRRVRNVDLTSEDVVSYQWFGVSRNVERDSIASPR